MKLTSNKIFSFMLAAAFALTLAGCGGGGGGTTADAGSGTARRGCRNLTPQMEMCEDDGRPVECGR